MADKIVNNTSHTRKITSRPLPRSQLRYFEANSIIFGFSSINFIIRWYFRI